MIQSYFSAKRFWALLSLIRICFCHFTSGLPPSITHRQLVLRTPFAGSFNNILTGTLLHNKSAWWWNLMRWCAFKVKCIFENDWYFFLQNTCMLKGEWIQILWHPIHKPGSIFQISIIQLTTRHFNFFSRTKFCLFTPRKIHVLLINIYRVLTLS